MEGGEQGTGKSAWGCLLLRRQSQEWVLPTFPLPGLGLCWPLLTHPSHKMLLGCDFPELLGSSTDEQRVPELVGHPCSLESSQVPWVLLRKVSFFQCTTSAAETLLSPGTCLYAVF